MLKTQQCFLAGLTDYKLKGKKVRYPFIIEDTHKKCSYEKIDFNMLFEKGSGLYYVMR